MKEKRKRMRPLNVQYRAYTKYIRVTQCVAACIKEEERKRREKGKNDQDERAEEERNRRWQISPIITIPRVRSCNAIRRRREDIAVQ